MGPNEQRLNDVRARLQHWAVPDTAGHAAAIEPYRSAVSTLESRAGVHGASTTAAVQQKAQERRSAVDHATNGVDYAAIADSVRDANAVIDTFLRDSAQLTSATLPPETRNVIGLAQDVVSVTVPIIGFSRLVFGWDAVSAIESQLAAVREEEAEAKLKQLEDGLIMSTDKLRGAAAPLVENSLAGLAGSIKEVPNVEEYGLTGVAGASALAAGGTALARARGGSAGSAAVGTGVRGASGSGSAAGRLLTGNGGDYSSGTPSGTPTPVQPGATGGPTPGKSVPGRSSTSDPQNTWHNNGSSSRPDDTTSSGSGTTADYDMRHGGILGTTGATGLVGAGSAAALGAAKLSANAGAASAALGGAGAAGSIPVSATVKPVSTASANALGAGGGLAGKVGSATGQATGASTGTGTSASGARGGLMGGAGAAGAGAEKSKSRSGARGLIAPELEEQEGPSIRSAAALSGSRRKSPTNMNVAG